MLRRIFYIITIILFTSISYFAQLSSYDEVLEGNINSDKTLSANKKYLLRGFVNVNEPATLTIPAGTIIFGEKSSKGTLIINRGAKINAVGTATKPIVFTSQQPVGQRSAGDWGGIILAGKASINVPGGTATVEGGTGTVYGGGSTPNDDDNSGVMKYVRIEFPGIAFLPDNEINGLTLAAVGRGTTIEFVQISYSGDDSFEWFGGTTNAKYLIAYKGVDDEFDTDFGFKGDLQFLFGLRDPNIADISGSNGFESDNDGTGTTNSPRTQPIFSNVTMVGPLVTPNFTAFNPNFKRALHIRRSSLCSMYNSIAIGYPVGLFIQSSNSVNGAIAGDLEIKNSIIAGTAKPSDLLTSDVQGFDVVSWYNTGNFGNKTFTTSSEVGLVDPFNLLKPDARPKSNSPAINAASFTSAKLKNTFFTQTTYIGAFDASSPRWDEAWTNYDPQNTNYNTTTNIEKPTGELPINYKLSQNYPNPFNPSTEIKFSLPKESYVKLSVFNLLGQKVAELINDKLSAGIYSYEWNAKNVTSGVYIYQLDTSYGSLAKKMTLLK